ncbi:class I SAM-dependent methyltransferase [Longimicrobium sp.]|uniref:class I SAM-dependent methyltransferase n=1 Tax=Longimicrobium sp. TaxID=2029185 RepID=UPI002E32D8AB|nr:class I SAM-dependent methyltransferase [Longimicrobium sp.]HEX6042105.1 class I SAM-dependent methyltransferase [Longimicrobium sp.]
MPADRIADAWARQDAWAGHDAADVRARVRADLGADSTAFLGCTRCGLEFADPPRSWSAGNYPPESYGIAWDHLRALALLRMEAPLRLLEIGCADGKFLERAVALGHRATGIDFGRAAVEAAQARGLDAHVADVREVRAFAGPEPFGCVALFQVIEHLEAPDDVFEAIGAVAAPDARLLIGCPADRRYTRRVGHAERIGRSDFWDYPPQHVLRWTPDALRIFLGRHGWTLVSAEYEPFDRVGAAAHLTAVSGRAGGWIGSPLRRRATTAGYLARLAAARLLGPMSGIRLSAVARREGVG